LGEQTGQPLPRDDDVQGQQEADSGPAPPDARVSLEEFLAVERLADLEQLYRDRGATSDGDELLKEIQAEWHRLAMWEARRTYAQTAPDAAPQRFEPERVEREGVQFAVYGLIHGHVGGDDRAYKDFVDAGLRELPHTVFENGLSYFYPKTSHETIPDFAVAGGLGSLRMGLMVAIEFPLLILELFSELLKIKLPFQSDASLLDYDPRFYALDPEVRRGVEPDPPLPSRPQIDYELTRWDQAGRWAGWKDPAAIVPRSMFMAGYAVGSAERRGEQRVDLAVGDLHTMEIVRFLGSPRWGEHPVFQAGRALALRPAFGRKLQFYKAKLTHLTAAGLAGAVILVPVMLLLHTLYRTLMPWWSGGQL
jgi:hypothetical protein